MMKKILSLSLFVFILIMPSFVFAQQEIITHVPGRYVFPLEFDVLSLDIIIPFEESSDMLNTITVRNVVSQFNGLYINGMRLYQDKGPEGFQGLGVDTELGQSVYLPGNRVYVFENINAEIPPEGLRLFFTIESGNSYSNDGLVQLALPQLLDMNGNSVYDQGDEGYFTQKKHNGPDVTLRNASLHNITTAGQDRIAPKSAIVYPTHESVVSDPSIVIRGVARDGGGATVQKLEIGIGTQMGEYNFYPAIPTKGSYEEWEYVWTPTANGTYYLVSMAVDGLSNISALSLPIQIQVGETIIIPEPEAPEIVREEIYQGLFFGDLIKSMNSSSVYYLSDSARRMAFPTIQVYRSWYHNFLEVKTISSEQMASIPFQGLIRYRPGVQMVKISSDSKVYAIDKGSVLRWIETEEIAQQLYGEDWNQQIHDLDITLFTQYVIGDPIESAEQYNKEKLLANIKTIQDN